MKEQKQKQESKETKKVKHLAGAISTRGRIFEGRVIRKFPKRITIEFERVIKIPKYERFMKKKTKIHARILEDQNVQIGDLVQVRGCRPLSKITHHIMIKNLETENK